VPHVCDRRSSQLPRDRRGVVSTAFSVLWRMPEKQISTAVT